MSKVFIFLWMMFFHIVDDYYLQGWLASAKQKSWWEKNSPEELYKHDYIMALFMHSFSWTFMIMLPIAWYVDFNIGLAFCGFFLFNMFVHMYTDDSIANKKIINLWQDQLIHIGQIFMTFMWLVVV